MIIFLHGADTYRSQKKLKEIIERYKSLHKGGLNFCRLDLEEKNFQGFKNFLGTNSMFKEKKLMVLNIYDDFSKDILDYFLKKNLEKSDQETIIFFKKGPVSKSQNLFKKLKSISKNQEFKLLDDYKLKTYIKKEIEKRGGTIGILALEKLVLYTANDLWQISNEIDKLISFSPNIKEENINLLVKPKIDPNIFKMIDAISSKDKKTALSLVYQHLEKGDNELYLISMIIWQFRNLIKVKEQCQFADYTQINQISRELKLHPFVVRKTMNLVKRFSLEELKKIYSKIFQADLNIKTGKIDSQTALDLLISEI